LTDSGKIKEIYPHRDFPEEVVANEKQITMTPSERGGVFGVLKSKTCDECDVLVKEADRIKISVKLRVCPLSLLVCA